MSQSQRVHLSASRWGSGRRQRLGERQEETGGEIGVRYQEKRISIEGRRVCWPVLAWWHMDPGIFSPPPQGALHKTDVTFVFDNFSSRKSRAGCLSFFVFYYFFVAVVGDEVRKRSLKEKKPKVTTHAAG